MAHAPLEQPPPPSEGDSFLAQVGEKVRTLRQQRGHSRRALAAAADVSERYLAQLEAGTGNCSIALLRRVADALGAPVAELVSDRSPEAMQLMRWLDRFSPSQLVEARDLLLSRFANIDREASADRIALIGLRGAGKSTLGRMLAEHLDLPFIELDRAVEQQSGMALDELFELLGQRTFRNLERTALEKILRETPRFVLSTGGGIVTEPGTFAALMASCLTVWLRAAPQEHMERVVRQGDMRPMASHPQAMDALVSILTRREPLYAQADLTLDTTGQQPEQSLAALLALLELQQQRRRDASRKQGDQEKQFISSFKS